MILVLLGTQNNSFTRLLEAVQENIDKKIINDEVVVQAGFTKFESKDMKIFKLIDKKKLSKLQDKADLIITHGGVGSIISSLEKATGLEFNVVPYFRNTTTSTSDLKFRVIHDDSEITSNDLILNEDVFVAIGKTEKKIDQISDFEGVTFGVLKDYVEILAII